MIAIRNYNDTRIELSVAMRELDRLVDKKERLYSRFFHLTTKAKDISKDLNACLRGSDCRTDPMTDYMVELEKIDDKTGKSLKQALQDQRNEVRILEYYLKLMANDMSNLKGIEYQLYYDIVINPLNATKSISKIIEEFAEKEDINKEVNTIWVNYYPKIKEYLEKLEKSSDYQVKSVK